MKKLLLLFLLLTLSSLQAQWFHQNSGVNVALNDVHCITEDIVVVVGGMGNILKTTDGGENWIQKTSNTTEHLNKVDFANSTTGYTVGDNGTLLKTIDTGEIWSIINTGATDELYAVSCVNENIVFISGENGLIKKTEDGGANWIIQNSGTTEAIVDIYFNDEIIGFASIEAVYPIGGILLKTNDGGNDWQTYYNNTNGWFSFCFYNENIMYLGSSDLLKSEDGGSNFEDTWYSCFANVYSLYSTQLDTIWTAGYDLMADGGCIGKGITVGSNYDDWTWVYTGGYYELYNAVHFASDTTGFVVGYNLNNTTGLILKNSTGINTGLDVNEEKKDFVKIYPNPTSNIIYIQLDDGNQVNTKIELTDILGKTVYANPINDTNKICIDTSKLTKGIYMITISNAQYQQQQKIIIQ